MIGVLETPVPVTRATTKIAILGCGNVGAEVARQLQARSEVEIVSVLVRDLTRERPVARAALTDSFDEVLASQPEVIIELLGGVEPARRCIESALQRGISVVTANQSVIARHGDSLHRIARGRGARLLYEAAVGAGVPVLAAINQLRGDQITAIRGIVNGTCNFILERVEKTRRSPAEALAEAQQLGFAEPDPAADITGRDSAEKLCVLAHGAGWGWTRVEDVETSGIESITVEDVQHARQRHCVIRLVAEAQRDGNGRVSLRVGPTLVPRGHALSTASGCGNTFEIVAENAGTIHIHGPGAGARPTASAVVSDVLALVPPRRRSRTRESSSATAQAAEAQPAMRRYYIRATTLDESLAPEELFRALDAHRVDPDVTELLRNRAVVHTFPTVRNRAEALAHHLGKGESRHALIVPYLD